MQSNMTVICESDRCFELNTIGEYTFAKMADVHIMHTETYLLTSSSSGRIYCRRIRHKNVFLAIMVALEN